MALDERVLLVVADVSSLEAPQLASYVVRSNSFAGIRFVYLS